MTDQYLILECLNCGHQYDELYQPDFGEDREPITDLKSCYECDPGPPFVEGSHELMDALKATMRKS